MPPLIQPSISDKHYFVVTSFFLTRQQLPNFIPRVDGDIVPVDPGVGWESGTANDKDFINGNTMHDSAFGVLLTVGYSGLIIIIKSFAFLSNLSLMPSPILDDF